MFERFEVVLILFGFATDKLGSYGLDVDRWNVKTALNYRWPLWGLNASWYHINSKQKLNPESGFIVEELLGVQKSAATETSHSLTLPTLLDGHLG